MKKWFPVISLFLILIFVSFDITAQTRTDRLDMEQTRRYRDIEEKISETICNLSWLIEVTDEQLRSEITPSTNPTSRFQFDLKNFIKSNEPCDNETGNRPLHLVLSSLIVSSFVADVLIAFGADLFVLNNDEAMPVEGSGYYWFAFRDEVGIDIEQVRNRLFEKKLSETICNLSWFTEVTGEQLQSEITVGAYYTSRLRFDLRNFIRSNKPCDNEAGNRPLHLALSSVRVRSSVIDVLIAFGADLYVLNNDGVMPVDGEGYNRRSHSSNNVRTLRELSGCSSITIARNGTLFCRSVNGVCNNSQRNSCSAGRANDAAIADTEIRYRWQCVGSNGGTTATNCRKLKFILQ